MRKMEIIRECQVRNLNESNPLKSAALTYVELSNPLQMRMCAEESQFRLRLVYQ